VPGSVKTLEQKIPPIQTSIIVVYTMERHTVNADRDAFQWSTRS